MKKIFTMILFAAGTISFASAQSHNQKDIARNDNRKVSNVYDQHSGYAKNNSVSYNDNYFSYKEMQKRIVRINREYDQRIAAVRSNRFLKNRQKNKQIEFLQNQKKNEISKVQFQYAKSNQKTDRKTPHHDSHKW
ncbi:MAG: hypothetical protein ABI683_14435 [Ginsengibacter sp.]